MADSKVGITRFAIALSAIVLSFTWAAVATAEPEAAAPSASSEEKAGHDHAEHGKGGAATADDHGHHDTSDIGHGNASKALSSPIDFRFDLAVWTFVVFFLLLVILGKFAWGPISAGLETRERGIETQIAEAHAASKKAAEKLRLYEAKLAAAAEEAREIAAQAKRDAESARDQILAEAKASAQRERDRAVADITSAKNAALQEIAEKSINTAVRLAGNIVKREINAKEHAALIRESMDNFPSAN